MCAAANKTAAHILGMAPKPFDEDNIRRDQAGKFDELIHSEPETVLLSADEWGTARIAVGGQTPWGRADSVEEVAPGISYASTEGHGGYKLSPARQKAIPETMRAAGAWYEHDAQWRIAALYHPDAFTKPGDDVAATQAESEQEVKDFEPDRWEATYGELDKGESLEKDKRLWLTEHADEYITTSGMSLGDGRVQVTALRRSSDERDTFILDRATYDELKRDAKADRGSGVHLLLPPGLVPEPRPEPEAEPDRYRAVPNLDGLSDSAQARVKKDLDQRWRDRNNQVRTLADIIENDGITDKLVLIDNGTRSYSLAVGPSAYRVSKATFDAFEAPDTRSPADIALEEVRILQHKYEVAQNKSRGSRFGGGSETRELAQKTAEARAIWKALLPEGHIDK